MEFTECLRRLHGPGRAKIFAGICQAAVEIVAIRLKDGRKLPFQRKFSDKFLHRVSPGVYEVLSLRAEAAGKSLNPIASEAL